VLTGTAMARHPEAFLPWLDAETGLAADGSGAPVTLLGP
jgi:hypothetical protein